MLFLLGIDSAFSFLEGFLTVLDDTKAFHNVDRMKTSFVVSFFAFLLSLLYATDAGLIFLDTIDYYINFVMLLVGGFEVCAEKWTISARVVLISLNHHYYTCIHKNRASQLGGCTRLKSRLRILEPL